MLLHFRGFALLFWLTTHIAEGAAAIIKLVVETEAHIVTAPLSRIGVTTNRGGGRECGAIRGPLLSAAQTGWRLRLALVAGG